MAMRKVTENEIWLDIENQQRATLEYLMNHVSNKYVELVEKIHHVDTQYREYNSPYSYDGYCWRIQGYISVDDFVKWSNSKTPFNDIHAIIRMPDKDTIEIWSLVIPFESNRTRVKRFK